MAGSVIVSVNAAMNIGNSEENGSAEANQTAGSTTTVESPHYSTTTVTDPGGTYMQYVEGSADQVIYTSNSEQIPHPVYIKEESGSSYTAAYDQRHCEETTAATYSQVASYSAQGNSAGQLLVQGNGAYVIKQDVNSDMAHTFTAVQRDGPPTVTADGDGVECMILGNTNHPPLLSDGHCNSSYSTCTTNDVDDWLKQNYEAAKGEVIPRSTLQNHYLRHCKENKFYHITASLLGKRIRDIFRGVEAKRLGKRGHSKYHYCGIRAKPAIYQASGDEKSAAGNRANPVSQMRQVPENEKSAVGIRAVPASAICQLSGNDKSAIGIRANPASEMCQLSGNEKSAVGIRAVPASEVCQLSGDENSAVRHQPSSQIPHKLLSGSGGSKSDIQKTEYQYEQNTNHSATCSNSNSSPQQLHHQQYLGDRSGAIPEFPVIEFPLGVPLPEDCTMEDADIFRSTYREHCEAFLGAVVKMEFRTIEMLWREFWRGQDGKKGNECEEKNCLSKTKLYLLCNSGPVQQFVWRVDCLFYQNLLAVLFPDVLRPVPRSVTQAIRNFAEGLELWLTGAMNGCPEEIMHIKMSAVSALAQTLRRYTSLNRLAQAARSVLESSSETDQLLDDLNRLDFRIVQEQASWMCQCDDSMLKQLEAHFKNTPHEQNSLEQWAVWMKDIVARVLKPHEGKQTFAKAARQFLLNWSLYSSVVFRDLTLQRLGRSGSLHLIRLLYDEYIFFLTEHQVALETGETFIATMAEKYRNNLYNVSDVIESGTCNSGVSLTMGVPVPVRSKMAARTLDAGTSDVNHHPVPRKRLKSSKQLQ
jgi:hypothetical protein